MTMRDQSSGMAFFEHPAPRLVYAVATLKDADPEGKIGYSTLEKELGIHRQQITRDVRKVVSRGWLIDLETKERSPRNLVLGEPIPDDEGLPTPESVRHAVTCLTDGEGEVIGTL
jgi:hypothetical protein